VTAPAPDEGDIPVLTEIVEDKIDRPAAPIESPLAPIDPPATPIDPDAVEALARQLEQALLERLTPEIMRVTAHAVREALAATLNPAAGEPKKD
jgi:hypothetical protein